MHANICKTCFKQYYYDVNVKSQPFQDTYLLTEAAKLLTSESVYTLKYYIKYHNA